MSMSALLVSVPGKIAGGFTHGPEVIRAAVPLLLVGATGDPATPYPWAGGALPYFPGSVLLTRDGDGHVSFGKSRCADAYEAAYLTRLALPPPGTVCPTN